MWLAMSIRSSTYFRNMVIVIFPRYSAINIKKKIGLSLDGQKRPPRDNFWQTGRKLAEKDKKVTGMRQLTGLTILSRFKSQLPK